MTSGKDLESKFRNMASASLVCPSINSFILQSNRQNFNVLIITTKS